jgi:hypothetical protein
MRRAGWPERVVFFKRKRSKKTFVHRSRPSIRPEPWANEQKFFAAFFKKEAPSLP